MSCSSDPDLLSLLEHPEEGCHRADVERMCGDGHDVVEDASQLSVQHYEQKEKDLFIVLTQLKKIKKSQHFIGILCGKYLTFKYVLLHSGNLSQLFDVLRTVKQINNQWITYQIMKIMMTNDH